MIFFYHHALEKREKLWPQTWRMHGIYVYVGSVQVGGELAISQAGGKGKSAVKRAP